MHHPILKRREEKYYVEFSIVLSWQTDVCANFFINFMRQEFEYKTYLLMRHTLSNGWLQFIRTFAFYMSIILGILFSSAVFCGGWKIIFFSRVLYSLHRHSSKFWKYLHIMYEFKICYSATQLYEYIKAFSFLGQWKRLRFSFLLLSCVAFLLLGRTIWNWLKIFLLNK